jgi:pimeloyl-ACP methyl ester carboxylesterase
LAGLLLTRGRYLAHLLGGAYPLSAAALDVAGLLALVVLLRFFDLATQRGFAWAWPTRPRVREFVRFGLVFALVGPFFVTLAQMHPQRIANTTTPATLGFDFTAVTFTTTDGVPLQAWFLPAPAGRPVILLTHGIGGNRQNFLPIAQMVQEFGYAVLLLDFRAHGDSDGLISTLGAREADDVRAAVAWLRTHEPHRPIYGLGYSMGGAALVRAEQGERLFAKLVLDCTYARAEHVGRQAMQQFWLPEPVIVGWWWQTCAWGWLLGGVALDDLRPEADLARHPDRPTLIIHGLADRTTPPSDAERLHAVTGGRAQLWLVPNAGHLGSANHPAYPERLRQFLQMPDA